MKYFSLNVKCILYRETLQSYAVRKVSAGENFSVFLTIDGDVFSCGAGNFGQLGNGSRSATSLHRLVAAQVTQVTCGRRHMLAYIPSRRSLCSLVLNSCVQIGRLYAPFKKKCLFYHSLIIYVVGSRSTNNSAVLNFLPGTWVTGLD